MLLSPIRCCDVTKPSFLLSGELCTSPLLMCRPSAVGAAVSASLCSEHVIPTQWATVVGEVTSPSRDTCATFAHPWPRPQTVAYFFLYPFQQSWNGMLTQNGTNKIIYISSGTLCVVGWPPLLQAYLLTQTYSVIKIMVYCSLAVPSLFQQHTSVFQPVHRTNNNIPITLNFTLPPNFMSSTQNYSVSFGGEHLLSSAFFKKYSGH